MLGRTTSSAALLALLALLAACTGTIGDAGVGSSGRADGADAQSPVQSPQSTPLRRLRRLSSREYDNVIRDLLGDESHPASAFVRDAYQNGYDNGSAGLAVQSDQAQGYELAAETLAANAVTNGLSALLGGCDLAQRGQPACLESFLSTFASRAYRRPLTTTEQQRLRDIFQVGAQTSGFAAGIQTTLEVILQSPQFLYREELGPQGATAPGGTNVHMTDYEVASELSFLLTGSIPDAELWSAVEQGRFATDADHAREATRLLASDGSKATLRSFLHAWMTTDRLASISKDARFYPTFSPALASSMAAELDSFYDSLLASGSLRDLFTSNQSFADDKLAALYGVAITGSTPQPVALDPQIRRGILSRAGFLAVHSDVDSSGPIARGVFALQSMLCSPPAPPPANVPPAAPAADPAVKSLTTRQRFDRHVSSSFCANCHDTIDGLGFGFEEFDGIGAYRTVENGSPVDSHGTIVGTGEIDGHYHGVAELAVKLAGSQHLVDCYVKQVYRYGMGQIEPDAAQLKAFSGSCSPDSRLTDLLFRLVSSPMFVDRVAEAQNGAGH